MAEVTTTTNEADASNFVLVVDNDAQSLIFLAMMLQRLAYPVCTANNAYKALDITQVSTPSLIIIEQNLSGSSGLELMLRMKQGALSMVPVIIMTRELLPEFEQQCKQAGAAGCLEKPVQANALYQTIYPLIEPRSRRADIRIPTRLNVRVNDRALDCVDGECATNLSTNGMYIRTVKPYPLNSQVVVQITLNGQVVTAEAKVVHSLDSDDGHAGMPGTGLQFITTTPQGREIIRRFINDEVSHGLAPGWQSGQENE